MFYSCALAFNNLGYLVWYIIDRVFVAQPRGGNVVGLSATRNDMVKPLKKQTAKSKLTSNRVYAKKCSLKESLTLIHSASHLTNLD